MALALALASGLTPGLALAQGPTAPQPSQSSTTRNLPPSVPAAVDGDRAAAIRGAQLAEADYRAAAHDAADAGGMPQLDFANPLTISQVVWLFVIFGAFVFIASQYLLPPVGQVLESRRARIEADLDAARAAKASADEAEAAHREATIRARAEAQSSIAAATQAAQAEAGRRAEELGARLDAQVAEAEARIARARTAAMGALRDVSTETAEALVGRLSGLADKPAIAAAVDRELAARKLQGAA